MIDNSGKLVQKIFSGIKITFLGLYRNDNICIKGWWRLWLYENEDEVVWNEDGYEEEDDEEEEAVGDEDKDEEEENMNKFVHLKITIY